MVGVENEVEVEVKAMFKSAEVEREREVKCVNGGRRKVLEREKWRGRRGE